MVCDENHTVRLYGTLRQISVTHVTSGVLTERNKCDLPQHLYFDEVFRSDWASRHGRELPAHMAVSPQFVEWLMGLPSGWTSAQPLSMDAASSHLVFAASLQCYPARHQTVSLFSGCGALDLALLPWCVPACYCDNCPAATSILRYRIRDGLLPQAHIFHDVRDLTGARILEQAPALQRPDDSEGPAGGLRTAGPRDVVAGGLRAAAGRGGLCAADSLGVVFGFPCTNTSKAGGRVGLSGEESSLAFEALRIAEELRANWLFVENVDGIRSADSSDDKLINAIRERGYNCRWVVLAASCAGSPQSRRRWFMLAWRGSFRPSDLMPPQEALRQFCAQEAGLDFNGGRPHPPAEWMIDKVGFCCSMPGVHVDSGI
jgi:hypothetical protein